MRVAPAYQIPKSRVEAIVPFQLVTPEALLNDQDIGDDDSDEDDNAAKKTKKKKKGQQPKRKSNLSSFRNKDFTRPAPKKDKEKQTTTTAASDSDSA